MLFYHDGNVLINIDSGLKISVNGSVISYTHPLKEEDIHFTEFVDADTARARFEGIVEKLAVSHSLV